MKELDLPQTYQVAGGEDPVNVAKTQDHPIYDFFARNDVAIGAIFIGTIGAIGSIMLAIHLYNTNFQVIYL